MTRVGERDQLISRVWLSVTICFWLGIIALHYHCYDLFVFFFMLKLLQYCNYIIIVMQIKLMLLLLLLVSFFVVIKRSISKFKWTKKEKPWSKKKTEPYHK